jgi:hypothetical protein
MSCMALARRVIVVGSTFLITASAPYPSMKAVSRAVAARTPVPGKRCPNEIAA